MEVADAGVLLRALRDRAPDGVGDSVAAAASRIGATDVVIYLVDFEQQVLTPVPGRSAHVDLPVSEPVAGTVAGTAYSHRRLVSEALPEGTRVWVPILEGSECKGVLALTVDGDVDDSTAVRCEDLGMLVGALVSVAARRTDLFNLVRRRKAMSLPASLQWATLPPLRLEAPEVLSVGMLEPAYEVGGDLFDHALNGPMLDLVVMDAMGHGLTASMASALAVGCYRHDRREGQTLATMHARLNAVLAEQYGGYPFVTGLLGQLDRLTGEFRWINAGHPPPLLIRNARVVKALECRPSVPWGLGAGLREEATERLRPGDALVFLTDGVTEGRSYEGTPFGLHRLIDLIEAESDESQPPDVILRAVVDAVLEYQDRALRDDATLLWVTWRGPARA